MSLTNATVGAHSFTAVATDNAGATTTSAVVSVTVEALPNVAPTVNLTAPTANAVFTQGTAITISATAADSDGTVTQVQFFDGATLIGTDTTAPYSMSLTNATVGAHSFTAVATDNAGATTTSAVVSVTVEALPNVAPTVNLTAPTANAVFTQGTAITISANAADSDGTVTQVQFFDGATLIGTDTTAPYSMSLTNATVGAHSFTAVATDNAVPQPPVLP
jgi:chitodextrinase